ncbi:putative transferase [Helianthus annuus]|uniref:Putative O-acyltransferase, WSD1 domain-containing protein n=1 Tax=Helianthus annuus TaxID=4232 RepID=A0A251UJA7_HELAN|nr:putative transferase [Helianthus annuus]
MDAIQDFNTLGSIRTTKYGETFEGFKKGEDDEEPLSPMAQLLHEPGSNMYIICFIGLKTKIRPDVIKENLVNAVVKNRRFSSLQVRDKANGSMKWIPTHVNIDDHVIIAELDPNIKSPDKFVENYILNLSRSGIESTKPLWDFHLIDVKTSEAEGTCIFRCHHSIGDGMSLTNLLMSCTRKVSDPDSVPTIPGMDRLGAAKVANLWSRLGVFWNTFVALLMFALTGLFLEDTKSPIKGSKGVEGRPRRFVTRSVSLEDIKFVKRAMNVDFTHKDNGTWGNKIGYLLLPFDIRFKKDPLDYVRHANSTMKRKKASLEPLFTYYFTKLVLMLFGTKVTGELTHKVVHKTTLIFSNIPGPQDEITLFGHKVAYLAPSCYGQPYALMINVVSYMDKVMFVMSVDEETIPDPQKLCDAFEESLRNIKASA